jgi:hypothetical protein
MQDIIVEAEVRKAKRQISKKQVSKSEIAANKRQKEGSNEWTKKN